MARPDPRIGSRCTGCSLSPGCTAIVDDVLVVVGSTNLDGRSLFLNSELMVAFHDAGDIARYIAWFDLERSTIRSYVAQPPGLMRDLGGSW